MSGARYKGHSEYLCIKFAPPSQVEVGIPPWGLKRPPCELIDACGSMTHISLLSCCDGFRKKCRHDFLCQSSRSERSLTFAKSDSC